MSFIDRLVGHWNMEQVTPDPHETAAAIDEFQRRFGVAMAADVRAFYERFNGLLCCEGLFGWDTDLSRFWPLQELDTVRNVVDPNASYSGIAANLPGADSYFAFADHSIWVHVYAVRLTSDATAPTPVVWIADGNTFATVANSFAGFWDRYLTEPGHIVVP